MFYVKFYSFISKAISYIIISISGLFYVQSLIVEPIEKVVPLALTAIATIAALGFHDLNKTLWSRYEKLAKINLKNK